MKGKAIVLLILSVIISTILAVSLSACKKASNTLTSNKTNSLSGLLQISGNEEGKTNSSTKELSSDITTQNSANNSQGQSKVNDTITIGEKINNNVSYIKAKNTTEKYPCIVKTIYSTEETVIASAVVTDFNADPLGIKDSTTAIKNAINYVFSLGGGTVFMPSGKYLVTDTITIPEYVTLYGDWQNPNINNSSYGTIILANPSTINLSENPKNNPLISMQSNSGVVGLTVYYPNQTINSIKKYGYTLYANSPTCLTVRNFTAINSCYGLGVSLGTNYNELVTVENFFGTFLYNAISHNGLTDVGSYTNISVTPDYWINANSEYRVTNADTLKTFLKENLQAFVLGDLDDQLLSKISVNYSQTAFKFINGIRDNSGFWGVINEANVLNSTTGIYSEALNSRSGVVFTLSSVGNINNASPRGVIKLCDTKYTNISGSGITFSEGGTYDLSKYKVNNIASSFLKTENLYIADIERTTTSSISDVSQALSNILNNIKNDGIVVVPNGIYTLKSGIQIPKNIELASTLGAFGRTSQTNEGKRGVVFVTYCDNTTFSLAENSGIRRVRIWHAKNAPNNALSLLKTNDAVVSNCTSITAGSDNAYALGVEVVGAFNAFNFNKTNNHIIKNCYGLAYSNFISAGGDNGKIIGCLANPNFVTRSTLYNYFESNYKSGWSVFNTEGENENFVLLRDEIGRTYTQMIKLSLSNNQLVYNTFCYGEAGLIDINNATNALIVNTSLDFTYAKNPIYKMNSGSAIIIGSLRVYGYSIKYVSGSLKAYGRIAFEQTHEKAFDSSISIIDENEYVSQNATKALLFDCESLPLSVSGVTLNTNSAYSKIGTNSWKKGGNSELIVSANFAAKDFSNYSKGYLHMYVYVDDASKIGEGQIELTSSGVCDAEEINWQFSSVITKNGWNEVYLSIYGAGVTGEKINLSRVNYLRIYSVGINTNVYIDYIEFVTD